MGINAPEGIIRALAQAPQTRIRDIALNALGYTYDLKPVDSAVRRAAEGDLQAWFDTDKMTQGELQ